jgi:orotidine-5'-phosphate decarboxylase
VGAVVGATIGADGAAHDLDIGGPLLAPGIGAQGAGPAELRAVFGTALPAVLASSSRAVLRGGPTVDGLRAAAAKTLDDVTSALGSHLAVE